MMASGRQRFPASGPRFLAGHPALDFL